MQRPSLDERRRSPIRRALVVAGVLGALAGCADGRVVHVPAPGAVPIATFQTLPDDLARSPQLRALQPRDTAGIEVTEAGADGALLPAALDALRALPDAPKQLSRISIYADTVNMTYEQNGIAGRSVSVLYRPGEDLYVGEPSFSDEETYALDRIDPAVPAALISAIEARVPNARVMRLDLDVGLSYGFGLVWYADVEDARGTLATVFADLDGAIVAVDAD